MKKGLLFLLLFIGLIFVSCSTKTTEYTITYHVDTNENTVTAITYAKDFILEKTNLPSATKEGYGIAGWYVDSNYTTQVKFPYTVTKDEHFYAKWAKLHKVSFSVNGTIFSTEEVMDEHTLSRKDAPTIEGGTFINWYVDSVCQIPYDFESKVYSDFTLYAKYEMETFTVSFMDDTSLLEKQIVSYKENAKVPDAPKKEGFIFKGWSIHEDIFEEFNFNTPITKNIVLYAYFEDGKQNLHSVTLWIDGIKTIVEIEDGKTLENIKLPEKEGYLLKSLYLDENKTISFDWTSKITEDIILYGSFEVLTYSIEFIVDEAVFYTTTASYNTTISSITAPDKRGYIFKGWSTSNTEYTAFDFNSTIHSNLKLYAFYEIQTFTIRYYDKANLLLESTINFNQTAENKSAPVKEGFTFKGWSTSESEFIRYDFNTKVTKDTSLYAFYEITKLTITFIHEGNSTTSNTDYNTTISAIEPSSKEGYTFKGWSLKKDVFEAYDFSAPVTKDITLYAYYVANEYTVKFINEGEEYYSCSASYNTTILFPDAPVKNGYVFKGWSTNSTEYIAFTKDTLVKQDISLYAFFTEEIIVTFIVDGIETIVKVGLGELIELPESPKKEGFQFLGWYLEEDKFDFSTPILENLTLVAKFSEIQIDLKSCGGYSEGFYFEATPVPNSSIADYVVTYRKKNTTTWSKVDDALIRLENNLIRCDAVGLAAGEYEVNIEVLEKKVDFTCTVSSYDRSGYAHFKASSGIGAYNNDGSLKANAVVVYVTDQNKNTVTAKIGSNTYTGLSEILQKQNGKIPVVIRIIGTINAATWNKIDYKINGVTSITPNQVVGANQKPLSLKTYDESELISGGFNDFSNDIQSGITKLNGLTNKIKYDPSKEEFDSYYNMLDISGAKNVTIEGIGTTAKLYQWGFTWKNCSSIEIRNLTFDDYTEDACSFEGSDDSTTLDGFTTGHIWIHHNTFNEGKNNWDVCNEQDKHEGDGATDFKKNAYITVAYNHYYKNHKTGLVGGSDSQHTACVTFHHNFYDQCSSRLPLGRQANMHMYNNYYYKSSGTNMSIRANGYALVENCVFEEVNNPFEVKATAAIKSYNNILTGCKGLNQATVVNSRTEAVENSNIYGTDFDTNASIFYYDATNKTSKVSILHETSKVKEYCKLYAGALKNSATNPGGSSGSNPNPTPPEETGTWETIFKDDFSSSSIITHTSNGSIPTEQGFYYTYTTGGNQELNHIAVSNGVLNINDTSDVATTYGYYIIGSSYTAKKVRISLDFTPQTSNGKWTPIHFLDGQQNLGIRTDADKVLGYTIDAGVTNVKILSSAMSAKTMYHIELLIDFTTKTTVVKIDSSSMEITGYAPEIQGIMFQTATAIRSFTIDNLHIETFN